VKLTFAPAVTLWLAGWVVTIGAIVTGVTVNVAALLVALPATLLTTQE
jgi:hypothetical protein